MSYQFYLVLHFVGIFLILVSLAGLSFHVAAGGSRNWPLRRFTAILHGVGLLIALVAGFGLLARLGFTKSIPVWAIGKLVIWLTLGALPALIYRKGAGTKTWIFMILALAIGACALAAYKPNFTGEPPLSNPDQTAP